MSVEGADFRTVSENLEPEGRKFLELVLRDRSRFRRDDLRAGVDLQCLEPTARGPNRARVKVYAPKPNVTVWFFYKDPRLSFSEDRFSYGAVVSKRGETLGNDALEEMLEFLRSGLDPAIRPAALRRTFPFTVPR